MRKPLPQKFAEAPLLHPWLQLFYLAFHDLFGDRAWENGPITWMARQKWAETHGLDEEATALLHSHVAAMDLAFLSAKADNKDGGEGRGIGGRIRRDGEGTDA
jgi:hypothetical protein